MKYEIWKGNKGSYMITKKGWFMTYGLTKEKGWRSLKEMATYTAMYAPRLFKTLEDAQKYITSKDKVPQELEGNWEKVSDEEAAFHQLNQ